jgi:signal peptidase I
MLIADLTRELNAPLKWMQDSRVTRDAMALITVSNAEGKASVLLSSEGVLGVDSKNYLLEPMEQVKAKNTPIRNAFTNTTRAATWIVVAFLFTFALLNMSGALKSQVVLTDSMSPTINPGDMVISTSPDRVTPEVGDVVVYSGKRFDGTKVAPFAHRIIAGNGQIGFTMKGDNNPDPDIQKPVFSDIEGVVLLTVPSVGKVLNPQMYVLLLICAFGIWIIMDAFRDKA